MNLYSKRREKVLRALSDNSVALLFSGKAPMCSADEAYPFVVDRNFYYLTGLEKEEMVLVLYKNGNETKEYLFIQPYDEVMARWVGGRMSEDEARAVSDVEIIREYGDLESFINSLLNGMRRDASFKCYFDFWHYETDQQETPAHRFANKLKAARPSLIMRDIYPILTSMRMIKDEYEITCVRQAIMTTKLGIEQMMKTIRPSMNEMVMEGVFDFVLKQNMCNENAFHTIAASGERATILHYSSNNQPMADGELFLCDLGATFKHYCADISRTFPVNGRFTERQREIYELVLQAQKIVEENARVGVKLKDIDKMVVDFYREELPKHGLNEDVREYYFHSVSHHLGLDTHDVELERGAALEAGNIITNEPGLYIAEEGIGIRIEDDLLITGTGAEVLSKDIVKDPDEIEKLMASV